MCGMGARRRSGRADLRSQAPDQGPTPRDLEKLVVGSLTKKRQGQRTVLGNELLAGCLSGGEWKWEGSENREIAVSDSRRLG